MNFTAPHTESFDVDQVMSSVERYRLILQLTEQAVTSGYVRNDWQGALNIVDSLAQLGELDTNSRLVRAKANIELGFLNDAMAELIELSNLDPWCATTQNLLGEVRLLKKKYKEAVRAFSNSINMKSITSLVTCETVSYLGRAMAFTFLNRWPAVIADMNTCSMLYHLKKARMHFWAGRHAQCALYLDILPDQIRSLPSAQYLRVRNIMASGRYDDALLEFPKLLCASYIGVPFLYSRAYCYFQTGDYQACINDLSKIINLSGRVVLIELNPVSRKVELVDICQVLKMRADSFKNLRQYPAAIEDYEKVIQCAPTAEVYLSRAQVLYSLGLVARALADIAKAEKSLSTEPELLSLKMLCLTRLNRDAEAMVLAQHILECEPGNTIAKMAMQVLHKSKEFSLPLQRSLSLNPSI